MKQGEPKRNPAAREARMRLRRKRLKRRRRIAIAVLCVILILIVLAVWGIIHLIRSHAGGGDQPSPSSGQAEDLKIVQEPEKQEEPEKAEPVTITVSAAGDCTLGTDENFDQSRSLNAYYDRNGPAYFLKNVRSVFDADDLTIVNLEGTLTGSASRQDKTYAFKGPADYTQILTDGGVDAANLANNHSRDYGEQSYTDTIAALDGAGITNFGYDRTAVVDVKGVKIGLVGTYELAEGMGCEDGMIRSIKAVEEQGAQIVIVSFHWGTERSNYPDETQVSLAHSAIDNGADLVLGHHPHVLQGIEVYNGKNIVYSLGNFCFGGNSNPSDKDTMIFQQTFTVQDGKTADDNVTNIIPCSISSESGRNNYQPTPLEGEEKDRVSQKIQEFSSGL